MLRKGYRVLASLVLKHYAPSRAIIRNKMNPNSNFNLDVLQLVYSDSQNLSSPAVVIWRAFRKIAQ